MRLTTYTDYTLRTLIYLARVAPEKATIAGVAGAYGISRNHIMKIVHDLGRAGYVTTERGRGGGVRLACPPETVNVGEVARWAEGGTPLVECFASGNACCITPACVLRTALAEAREAFFAVLDGYTLAELTRPGRALDRLLGLPTQPGTAPA
ncbi:transcriptional regulator, BadM/Rrf2 family [Limimonas halophila]|uniref:Transcriptional regulator, BadM/Rrf2 family n=1 Tax=Limimonas halophila TaxID=1082479 RepID=A0A1G7QRB0_9PROT|nr:Rrf2 family transcriptional regulator [Limimonas halophila]SDG01042.1 transcriptional regulator, BadM/Rrf2 family [Limimonas halophila]